MDRIYMRYIAYEELRGTSQVIGKFLEVSRIETLVRK